ncbi:serine/threonine protein kinase, CMGC, CDC2/CDK sub [Entomophthora muscae]|uniref:Serine/threonine protein kinase, CMGC, CDC2/CDK sub n=1 Tax=Entomophthora muscae TaxID=34485 RepID=A0ACC2SYR6_9FUNG|nr:serine/threonine protein kinase, CMGC, CDC2/CDK sub [Entomophthora muscae]
MSDKDLVASSRSSFSPLSMLSSPNEVPDPAVLTIPQDSSIPIETSEQVTLHNTAEDAVPSVAQGSNYLLSTPQVNFLEKEESACPTALTEFPASDTKFKPSNSASPNISKSSPRFDATPVSAEATILKELDLVATTSDPISLDQSSKTVCPNINPEPLDSSLESKEVTVDTTEATDPNDYTKSVQINGTDKVPKTDPDLRSYNSSISTPALPNSRLESDSSIHEYKNGSLAAKSLPILSGVASSTSQPTNTLSSKTTRNANESRRTGHISNRKFLGCSSKEEYAFDRKLGEGTFGEVHKGRHLKTSKVVALKRILMHNEKEGIPITAIREIKILKALSHPNILSLLDIIFVKGEQFGPNRASIYMVTPFMDHDLSGLIENPKVRFSLPQIKCYMKQLFEGIFYLHNNNILHRDIKTANLLINNDGILKVADFGLSRPCESPDAEYTSCVVTRWYRPPELFLGQKNYTSSIDMWGVGCVFGQILQSKPLIPGKNDIEQLDLIFKLCGSPNAESFPGYNELPNSDTITFNSYPRRILEHFSGFDQYAVDLLDQLLVLDPKRRISANNALSHYFFYMDPLPAHPSSLPKYDSSHEYDRRNKDEARNSRGLGQVRNFSSGNDRTRSSGLGLHRKQLDSQGRDSGPKRVRHGHANIRNINGQEVPREDSFRYNAVGGRDFGPGAWSRALDEP